MRINTLSVIYISLSLKCKIHCVTVQFFDSVVRASFGHSKCDVGNTMDDMDLFLKQADRVIRNVPITSSSVFPEPLRGTAEHVDAYLKTYLKSSYHDTLFIPHDKFSAPNDVEEHLVIVRCNAAISISVESLNDMVRENRFQRDRFYPIRAIEIGKFELLEHHQQTYTRNGTILKACIVVTLSEGAVAEISPFLIHLNVDLEKQYRVSHVKVSEIPNKIGVTMSTEDCLAVKTLLDTVHNVYPLTKLKITTETAEDNFRVVVKNIDGAINYNTMLLLIELCCIKNSTMSNWLKPDWPVVTADDIIVYITDADETTLIFSVASHKNISWVSQRKKNTSLHAFHERRRKNRTNYKMMTSSIHALSTRSAHRINQKKTERGTIENMDAFMDD